MKKVAILTFHNMRYCPYLNFYIDILNRCENISYDIIFFNREKKLNEVLDNNKFKVDWIGKYNNNIVLKIINFINYYFKVKKILKTKNYDNVIVLTTIPGVILSKFLSKKYYKKYIIDVRDYSWEKLPFYFKREKILFDSSLFNIISSPDFTLFLPKSHYLLCHNLNCHEISKNKKINKNLNDTISIAYIGSISYVENCIKLIDLVVKDERFSINFYGNETRKNIISNYISNLNCKRVNYYGPYTPNQTEFLYEKSNLIFNCYGNNNALVKYAISNKYYYGVLYHRPLLVSPNTTMSRLVGKFGFSLDLENDKNLNKLFKWYEQLDEKEFDQYANKSLEVAINNNNKLAEKIINVLLEDINE